MTMILEKGKRVYLRYPEIADRAEFLGLRKESEELHRPWEPLPPPEMDVYGSAAFTRYQIASTQERSRHFLICRRKDDAIVGAASLNEITRGCLQSAYLGYWVGAPFEGQGYMTDGVRLVIRHAFETLRLHRIEANIQPENEPSLALAKRCAFQLEGYSPRYLKIAGRWQDHERWAILREDWKKNRGQVANEGDDDR